MSYYSNWTTAVLLFAINAMASAVRADIFRWDTGNMIAGTQGVVAGPGVVLSNRELQFADLAGTDLRGASFLYSNVSNATFELANLSNADLRGTVENANFTGAIVTGAKLTSRDFAKEQLYATASYRARDLHGIDFGRFDIAWTPILSDLTGWDFSSQNLTGGNFDQAILSNTNLTRADARGATGLNLEGANSTNLIHASGWIHGFDLAAGQRLVASPGVPIPVQFGSDYSIAPDATLDLGDNVAIVDSGSALRVRDQILSGRGGMGFGGSWTGTGITSSTAASANATEGDTRSLGYVHNGTMPLGPYTTFHGVPVNQSSVLIAYTRTGDANLDGVVNDVDVAIVAATYAPGVPQPHWALGDFDYNGFVDDADVTLLSALYDPTAEPLITPAPPGLSAVAAVPEPGAVALMVAGLAAVLPAGAVRRKSR